MNVHYLSNEVSEAPKRVAVIGSGISGVSAAWLLHEAHDVALFEAESRFGGHTCTVDIDYDGKDISVDVGFIVFNERNYPNLCGLFERLGVKTETSNMSFSVSLDGGEREWCGQGLNAVFAQRRNLISLGFWKMLAEVLRFNRIALKDRDTGFMQAMTIGEYLAARRFSKRFTSDYLIPMGAAIWSTPEVKMLEFPAKAFINFFENHRLLEISPPFWKTVSGGSKNYHQKMIAALGSRAKANMPVASVKRDGIECVVTFESGKTERFDHVILATHSDQALKLLADADETETKILSDVGYKENRVVLHRDTRFMPTRKAAWAAWNALQDSKNPDGDISLTYWMNRLQNIDEDYPLFVTLNPAFEPEPGTVFGEWSFAHPQYDTAAFDAQTRLPEIQGTRNIWFAGAWTGYGFHEDGLKSGMAAAMALGARVPWPTSVKATSPPPASALEAAE
ncbi:MAG: FAD-dependent oxidoreductase [Pseudomonadota bacterium]